MPDAFTRMLLNFDPLNEQQVDRPLAPADFGSGRLPVTESTPATEQRTLAPGIREVPVPGKQARRATDDGTQGLVNQALSPTSNLNEMRVKQANGQELLLKTTPLEARQPDTALTPEGEQPIPQAAEGGEEPGRLQRASDYLTSPEGRVLLGQVGKALAGDNKALSALGDVAIGTARADIYKNAEEAVRAGEVPAVEGLNIEQQQDISNLRTELSEAKNAKQSQDIVDRLNQAREASLPTVSEKFAHDLEMKATSSAGARNLQHFSYENKGRKYWAFWDTDTDGNRVQRIIGSSPVDPGGRDKDLSDKQRQDLYYTADKKVMQTVAQRIVGEYGTAAQMVQTADGSFTLATSNPDAQNQYQGELAEEIYREQLQGTLPEVWFGYDVTKPPTLKIGDVRNGHRYLGGDPKEKTNWLKVLPAASDL